jgi:hypothetical protein
VPLTACAETAESPAAPALASFESRWARTIRAAVARAIGRRAEAEAYGCIRPAAARGSTFLSLLALMLAAAVFALVVALGFAALVVVPAAVAGVVIGLG